MTTKRSTDTQDNAADHSTEFASRASQGQGESTLLPPSSPESERMIKIPKLPSVGKIRQYELTLDVWSPFAMQEGRPTEIDGLSPRNGDDGSSGTKLSSKSRSLGTRRRRAA